MAKTLRIAGIQMAVSADLDTNLPKILHNLSIAAEEGAQFVLFPEMSLSGYHGNYDFEKVKGAVETIRIALRELRVGAIISTGWREGGEAFIQQRAYDECGDLLGTHEKMIPTGIDGESGDRAFCVPGKELRTFQWNGITCGMLICNDMWATPGCGPHKDLRLMYQLGQKGTRIVFHSINSGAGARHTPYHESNISLRAEESHMYVCTANAARPDRGINCSSGVVAPDGQWVTRVHRVGEGRYHAVLIL